MNNDNLNNLSGDGQQGQTFGDASKQNQQSGGAAQQEQYTQGQYGQTQYGQAQYGQTPYYIDESGMFSENKLARKNGTAAAVKLGDWMALDCIGFLNLIPLLGSIAALVIYLVIAFSSKTSYSVKTRVRANFIWALIAIGIYIVMLVLALTVFSSLFHEISREFSRGSNFARYYY